MVLGKYVLFSQLPGANRRNRASAARKQQQQPKRAAPKAEWNSYLTDDGKHALSAAELQRRKELSVSKHHILSQSGLVAAREMRTFRSISIHSPSTSPVAQQLEPAKKGATFSPAAAHNESAGGSNGSNDVTALDLLSPPPRHNAKRTFNAAAHNSTSASSPGASSVLFPPSPGSPFGHGDLETTLDQLQPRGRFTAAASATGASNSSSDNKENVPPPKPFSRLQKQQEQDGEEDEEEDDDDEEEEGGQRSMSRFSLRSGPSVASLAKQRPIKTSTSTRTRRATRPRPARTPLSILVPPAPTPSSHVSSHAYSRSHTPSSSSPLAAADFDLALMADQIRTLSGELLFYEEISGKRPILGDAAADGAAAAGGGGGGGDVAAALGPGATAGGVMRALVQLTCKSMTYLLQAEVCRVPDILTFHSI